MMKPQEVMEHLEDLAEALGVEIVYEKLRNEEFRVEGGLCRIKGRYKIFVDRAENVENQIWVLAKALSFLDTEEIYVLPHVRGLLEKAGGAS
jgi:hypothetical protein